MIDYKYIKKYLVIIASVVLFSLSALFTASCEASVEGADTNKAEADGKKDISTDRTLFENSQSDAYGSVSGLTVNASRNLGVTYDVYSYISRAEKTVYIFLPCRADISKVNFTARHSDGRESGPYSADFSSSEVPLRKDTDKNKRVMISGSEYKVVALQSNLPTLQLKINEEHGKFSAVNASSDHSVFAYGDFVLEVTDELASEKGWETVYKSKENDPSSPETMSIRGRGNWTWYQAKKPYQLKTENKIDVLGMGKAKKWLLIANVMDASLLRNQLFFNLSADIGLAYSPKLEPVDLFINGTYMGNYFISTKVEVDENRVNIDENKDFLLEFDHYAYNETYTFTTKRGFPVTLHNREDFASVAEIEDIINGIEKLIYDTSTNDYAEYIDIESWAKYYWVQDLSRNNDTLIGSSYIYYIASENKLYAGPIWDMDNTLGIWGGGRNLKKEGWHSREFNWFTKLIQHSDFAEEVDRLYHESVRELFASLPEKVSEYEKYISLSAEMNYIVNAREHFVPTQPKDYKGDIEYLQDFLQTRIIWYEDTYDGVSASSAKQNQGTKNNEKVTLITSGGKGTQSEPYLISSPDEFLSFTKCIKNGETYKDIYFAQTADIDMSNVKDYSGMGSECTFAGTYDGCGYSINVNLSGSDGCIFPYLTGIVMNLKTSGTIKNTSYTGGIARSVRGEGIVINCISDVNIYSDANTGGITASSNENAYILNCFVSGEIVSGASVSAVNPYTAGQITMKNNFYGGDVTGFNISDGTVSVLKNDEAVEKLNSSMSDSAQEAGIDVSVLCKWKNSEGGDPNRVPEFIKKKVQ